MSLRTRIAAAAGAGGCSRGPGRGGGHLPRCARRAARRGRRLAARARRHDRAARRRPAGSRPGAADGRGETVRAARRLPRRGPSRSEDRRAIAQLVLPEAGVLRPPGADESAPRGRARPGDRAQRGSGEYLTDTTVDGTHLRVLTARRGRSRGGPGRAPARRGGPPARPRAPGAAARGRRRRGARRGPRRARGTHRARADRAASRGAPRSWPPTRDPSQRIESPGEDELGRLARSFNTTLDALERSVEAQRHLVADASHELRTPIASLRANIQTLERRRPAAGAERAGLREDIVVELDELTALVADIVELARGAKPGELRRRRAGRRDRRAGGRSAPGRARRMA